MRCLADSVEHEESQWIADEAMKAVAKSQAEAGHDPNNANDSQCDNALEHRRHHILQTNHPAVKKRQARSHQKDQCRRGQHPGHIARIDRPAGRDRLR